MTPSKTSAKAKIRRLIEEYEQLKAAGKLETYNEANTRKDFIMPLFEALGWNVRSSAEVSEEETVSNGSVDYAFKLNGITKFYLETKKFSVDLEEERWAEQAINYAWYKSVTWAVLSDFEGIKIFNAEWKEHHVSRNRYLEFNYTEYLTRFDELWLLSRESLEGGLLDQAAEKVGKKTKRKPVNEAIFADLIEWRKELLSSIEDMKQDIELSDDEKEEVVQKILDRLIFIRSCEDQGFEEQLLQAALRTWEDHEEKESLYERVVEVFQHYYRYDSPLFHAGHPCEKLNLYNGTLRKILKGLYFNVSEKIPYDFKNIPADILGGIYEQYLGYILKKGKLVKGMPHRKEKGIYYTPKYIVDYIVENTLGKLLKEIPREKAGQIKILDPACGSGSFLIKALEVMDEYYEKDPQFKKYPFSRRIKALTNNIYGVDLDEKAVEIAQLNLMLRALTGRRELPDISSNIKCGNSLISGTPEELNKYFGADWRDKKPFNWEEEFPHVFKQGGFDVIIGNPPYVGWAKGKQSREEKDYYEYKYHEIYSGKNDLFYYFIKRSIDLLKDGGYFSFIVSRYFLESIWAKALREYILDKTRVINLVDFRNERVFADASVHTCIFVLQKIAQKSNKISVIYDSLSEKPFAINQDALKGQDVWQLQPKTGALIIQKIIEKGKPISDFLDIKDTLLSALDEVYVVNKKTIREKKLEKNYLKPFLTSKNIKEKYYYEIPNKYMIHINKSSDLSKNPNLKRYLEQNMKQIIERNRKRKENLGIGLARPMFNYPWGSEKIFCPSRAQENNFVLDTKGMVGSRHNVTVFFNKSKKDSLYFVGLLNSRLFDFYFKSITKKMGRSYEYLPQYLNKLFVKVPDNEIISKSAKALIHLKNVLFNTPENTNKWRKLKEEIERTDRKIDEEVYKLYGLTEEEIRVVEKMSKGGK